MPLGLMISRLTEDPIFYFSWVFAVVLSVVLHELGHGFAAIWQGDDTPRETGHMTLDPMVHMGGFSILLLLIVGIAFGSMPVNPSRFRSKYGDAYVSFAGPAVNLLLALIALTALGAWQRFGGPPESALAANAQQFLGLLGFLNIALFAFNLLPIPPLDGSTVLGNFSPGYKRLVSDPNNQPIFMGGFILVFFFAGELFAWADSTAAAYLRLWLA